MAATIWFGAILSVSGIVMLALAAINQGQLSDSHTDPIAGRTP
jgi:drug/metabolite transporter (DMT)-like permease